MTTNLDDLIQRGYTVSLTCEPETNPIEGSAMASGDDAYDEKVYADIREQLDNGNEWAWCCVRVRVSHPEAPGIDGTDYLGECSYKDEAEFRSGGYFEDMVSNAFDWFAVKAEKISAFAREKL